MTDEVFKVFVSLLKTEQKNKIIYIFIFFTVTLAEENFFAFSGSF